MIFYPVGLLLTAIRLIVQAGPWSQILLSVGVTVAISLALPFLGLWGGADGKAFICLALMNPLIPSLGNLPRVVDPFFPLVVFSNAYLASLASMLYPTQRNLRMHRRNMLFEGLEDESYLHKVTAFLTGYQVPMAELESRPHLFLLESVHMQGSIVRRRFELDPRVDLDRSKEFAEIKKAADLGLIRGGIWVSPGLPFLVFLTSGLGVSLLCGDVLWSLVVALMRAIVALV
jgi:preflagellin peptidase FlaK